MNCERCGNAGIVESAEGGFMQCPCYYQRKVEHKLGPVLAGARLATMKARTTEQARALEIIRKDINRSRYIKGPNRSGKTYLAAALHNLFVIEKKEIVSTAWVDSDILRKKLSNIDGTDDIGFEITDIITGKVKRLFIDDLGKESITPWARQEYHRLFTVAQRFGIQLVITSNFSIVELEGDTTYEFLGMGPATRIIDIMNREEIEILGSAMDCDTAGIV